MNRATPRWRYTPEKEFKQSSNKFNGIFIIIIFFKSRQSNIRKRDRKEQRRVKAGTVGISVGRAWIKG